MEIDQSTIQEKAGPLTRAWGLLKALPGNAEAEILRVAKSIKKLGKDDPRRIIHSLKVGLALTLLSLIYYLRPLYDGFGTAGIWAVLTVVVVFEFTVGKLIGKAGVLIILAQKDSKSSHITYLHLFIVQVEP